MDNWNNRDWKWLFGVFTGVLLIIITAWLANIKEIASYFSFLGAGISIVLALVAIYISLTQNSSAQSINDKTNEMLIRIEERLGNVNEKVDKLDSKEIAKVVETRVSNVLEYYSKTMFNALEKVGIDQQKIESVKVAVPVAKALVSKVAKISVTSPILSYRVTNEGPIGYTTYAVYDQYGDDITTRPSLDKKLMFNSQVGTATGTNGLLTVRDLKDDYSKQAGTDVITISDETTGVSARATLVIK